jgi:hypothetical protein
MKNVSTHVGEKIKQHIFSVTFFFENFTVYEIILKNIVVGRGRPHDNMAHAHCMLDN